MANRKGCFVAISRCIWGDPSRSRHRPVATMETIEFENLVNAENRTVSSPHKLTAPVWRLCIGRHSYDF